MKVQDIMTKNPETASPGTTVADVARMMRDLDVGIIPVVSDSRLVGVITDRDIAIRVVPDGLNALDTSVQDFLSPNPVCISPDDSVEEARKLMAEHQVRRLLVCEDDKLVGIVSIGDVATKDKSEDKATGKTLEEISEPAKTP